MLRRETEALIKTWPESGQGAQVTRQNDPPRGQIWSLKGGGFKDNGRIIWDVEEDQIGSDEMDNHPQEHHRGSSEAAVFAQQSEQSSPWWERRSSVWTQRPPFKSPRHTLSDESKPTYYFSNSYHNPRDPDQAFSSFSKVRRCSDTRSVHAAVEAQLQAWRTWRTFYWTWTLLLKRLKDFTTRTRLSYRCMPCRESGAI